MSHSLSKTIHNIYDAALHTEQWPNVVRQISDLLNASTAELTLMDTSKTEPEFTYRSRIAPETYDEYFPELYLSDPRIPRMLLLPDKGGIHTERLLSDQEWKENIQLREFLDRKEIGNLVASNATTRGMITWLGMGRKGYNNPFTASEMALYNTILPHVTRALRIHLTVRDLNLCCDGLAGLLSLDDKAVIFLDQKSHIIFVNHLATCLADKKVIHLTNKRLSLCDHNTSKCLSASLQALGDGLGKNDKSQEVMIFRGPDGCEYGLRILPYRGDVLNKHDGMAQQNLIVINNLDVMKKPEAAEIARFATLFKLTNAESNVVVAIASMRSLQEYVRDRNIKVDTARKQLKSAMQKIGVRSQKEMLRLLDRFCFVQMR